MKKELENTIKDLLGQGYDPKEILDATEYLMNRDRLLVLVVMHQDNKEDGWKYVSIHEKLPTKFIKEFEDCLDWDEMSLHQSLTEELIEEHSDEVNWFYVFMKQDLSGEFIEDHLDEIRAAVEKAMYNNLL